MKKDRDKNYCKECDYRKGDTHTPSRPLETNRNMNCPAKYTQNPKSEQATRNALKAGGIICSVNPWIQQIKEKGE